MEHVRAPPNPTYDLPTVPLLGRIYDGWDFQSYPELKGWNKIETLRGSFLARTRGRHKEELASFVQEWLFFGLLTEVLKVYNIYVDIENDFLRRERGRVYITTEKLEEYLSRAMEADLHAPAQERLSRVIRSSFLFDTARKYSATTLSADGVHADAFPPEVALSIITLGATLQGAVQFMAKDVMPLQFDEMHPAVAVSLVGLETVPSAYVRERLAQANWCPSETRRLEIFLDVRNLLYVSMIDRPLMKTNHEDCTRDICVAHTVDETSYETQHVSADCECFHIGPDPETIAAIYRRNGIPAIRITDDGEDLSVSAVDAKAGRMAYIAISHVWADGLGNPQANTLPECQLRRLSNMMREMDDTDKCDTIWIDTLCVPLQRDVRDLAIAAMADIYRWATGVLVLDQELQDVPANADSNRLMLQIGISGWAKRLWTLQEGVFAQNLHFRLKDGFVNSFTLQMMEQIRVMLDPHLWRPSMRLREFYNDRAPSDYGSFGPLVAEQHPIIKWSMSLMFRATSRQADETICLASLAGLDVGRLLKQKNIEERVRELFTMIGDIPAPILFLEGDRIQIDGFRWAPRSLLEFSSSLGTTLMEGDNLTQMVPLGSSGKGGITVAYPGFLMSIRKNMTLREDDDPTKFYAWVDSTDDTKSILLRFRTAEDRERTMDHRRIAVVMEKGLADMPRAFVGAVEDRHDGEDGANVISYLFPVTAISRKDVSKAVAAIDGRIGVDMKENPFPHIGTWSKELGAEQLWSVR